MERKDKNSLEGASSEAGESRRVHGDFSQLSQFCESCAPATAFLPNFSPRLGRFFGSGDRNEIQTVAEWLLVSGETGWLLEWCVIDGG